MKICIDCGKELENGVDTCECTENAKSKVLSNPVIELVRQSVRSKLFLSAMIVFTLAVAINIFNDWISWFESSIDFKIGEYCLYNITNIFSRIGINDGKGMLLLVAICGGSIFDIASAVPSIMLAVGMWMAYGCVNDEDNYPIKPKGFWLVETMLTLFVGVTFWGTLLTMVGSGIFFQSLIDNSIFSGWEDILAAAYLLISPFCQIAVAMFYINVYRIVHNIRSSIEKRAVSEIRPLWGKTAISFGGISIIFTLISSAVISEYPSGMVASNLISAVATVLFGIFMLLFSNRINNFIKNKADYNNIS